jgi:hypothetical protein
LEQLKPVSTIKDRLNKERKKVNDILNIIIYSASIILFGTMLVKFILSKI